MSRAAWMAAAQAAAYPDYQPSWSLTPQNAAAKAASGEMAFSRGTLATQTDPDGSISYPPHNYVIKSETFQTGDMVAASSVSISESDTTAIGGVKLRLITALAGQPRCEAYNVGAYCTKTASQFVKKGNVRYAILGIYISPVDLVFILDLDTGSVHYLNSLAGWITQAGAIPVETGYRFWVTVTNTTSTVSTTGFKFCGFSPAGFSQAVANVSTMYCGGLQVNDGPLLPYCKTLDLPVHKLRDVDHTDSMGPVLGPELVVNGQFQNGVAGWTAMGTGAILSVSNGLASIANGTAEASLVLPTLPAGKTYQFTAYVTNMVTTGTAYFVFPNSSGTIPRAGVGMMQGIFYSGTGGMIRLAVGTAAAGASITVSSISLREVLDYAPQQPQQLGPELNAGGHFNDPDGWSLISGTYIYGGQVLVTIAVGGGGLIAARSAKVVAGKAYQVRYRIDSLVTSGGGASVAVGGRTGQVNTVAGVYTETIIAGADSNIDLRSRGGGLSSAQFSELSVREIQSYNWTNGDLLSEEIFDDPYFKSPTYWSAGAGWSISGGTATRVASASSSNLGRSAAVIPGRTYLITVNVVAISGDGIALYAGSGNRHINTITAAGTYAQQVTAGTDSVAFISAISANTTVTLSQYSLREVLNTGGTNPQQYGPELVVNGTFDNANHWSKNGVASNLTFSNGYALVTCTAARDAWISQKLTLTVGKTYRLQMGSESGAPRWTGPVANWQSSREMTFVATQADPWLSLTCDAVGQSQFDNVSIREVLGVAGGNLPVQSSSNLLANGDFSNGATGWVSNILSSLVVSHYRVTATTSAAGDCGFYQDIVTVPGRFYTVRAQMSNYASAAAVAIRVAQTNWSAAYWSNNILAGAAGTASLTFVAISTTTRISFDRRGAGSVSGDAFTVNDASVRELYEYVPLTVPIYGPELLTNTLGDNAANWNMYSCTVAVPGEFALTSTSLAPLSANIAQGIKCVVGRTYAYNVEGRVGNCNAVGVVRRGLNDSYPTLITTSSKLQTTMSGTFVADTANEVIHLLASASIAGQVGYFDNPSVKEITGWTTPTAAIRCESYGTNLVPLSNPLTVDGNWRGADISPPSTCVAAGTNILAPDLTPTARLFTPGAGGNVTTVPGGEGANRLWWQYNGANGAFTNSIWVRTATQSSLVSIHVGCAGVDVSAGVTTVQTTNEWQRIRITATTTTGSGGCRFLLLSQYPIYIWGAQCEAGLELTNLIPAYGSATTRGSDLITFPANVIPGADTREYGTLIGSAKGSQNTYIAELYSTAVSRVVLMTNGNAIAGPGGTNVIGVPYAIENRVQGLIWSRPTGSSTAAKNGTIYPTGVSVGAVSAPTTLAVGSYRSAGGGGQFLNGSLYRLDYYPVAVRPYKLQSLTFS